MLQFMGSQSWTQLNDWTELKLSVYIVQQEKYNQYFVVVVQSLSHVWLCDPMECRMTGFPVFHCLLEFTQTHILWINNSIQPSYPLSPSLLQPSIFPCIRVFPIESAVCIRWSIYLTFSFTTSNEYLGLISFTIDLFDLLTVHGTLKSLLQHHSLKASILQCSAFLLAQLSHLYMTTGKTIVLTIRIFVGKLMPFLLIHCLVLITFFPRSKSLLISWLQQLFIVILEPKKIKPVTVSIPPLHLFAWNDGNITMFCNNYKWSITFKNCESLYCALVTCVILYSNYLSQFWTLEVQT